MQRGGVLAGSEVVVKAPKLGSSSEWAEGEVNDLLKTAKGILSRPLAELREKYQDSHDTLESVCLEFSSRPCPEGVNLVEYLWLLQGATLSFEAIAGDLEVFVNLPTYKQLARLMVLVKHWCDRYFVERFSGLLIRKDAQETTLLQTAVVNNHLPTVKFLHACGADLFELDEGGSSLLHYCRSKNIAQFLIDQGLDKERKNKLSMSVVHAAALGFINVRSEYNNEELLKFYFSLGMFNYLNAKDSRGKTPLHLAVENERYQAAGFLLACGSILSRKIKKLKQWNPKRVESYWNKFAKTESPSEYITLLPQVSPLPKCPPEQCIFGPGLNW